MQLRGLIPHRTRITVVLLALGMGMSSGAPTAAQEQSSAFRVAVDLVPVDVQVLDGQGHPVVDLTPGEFDVTINGRRRRVVSAALISDRTTAGRENQPATTSAVAVADGGRVIVIAIDCLSISVAVTRGATDAAREFINRLSPADRVGLFAYPIGPRMDPTTDHAAVIRALGQVVGQRENMLTSLQFQLRPSELIDLSAELARAETEPFRETTPGGQIARRECGESLPLDCVRRLIQDVNGATLYYEGEATASVGTLRGLLREMGTLTGRKTLVLVTGGMIASDTPGVRPDVSDLGHQAGREAALANTAVYTLHIDVSALEHVSAQTAAADQSFSNIARDSVLLGGWLDQFSAEAGGTLFKVLAGRGESAYDRILTETTAHYLLGVEVGDADRDGRTQEIQVKVKRRSVTVRGRKWVAIPKRRKDATTTSPEASTAPPASSPSSAAPSAPRLVTPLPRPLPRDVQTLADAFERGDWSAMERGLAETKDLANLLTGFRAADRPWPDAPRRRAVFALEIGLAGLRSDNGYARDEGSRLLAEYNTLVRQPGTGDVFECAWLWTQAAGLEGALRPNIAAVFISRAAQRCPNEPRLNLALAVVTEQQWLRNAQTSAAETAEVKRRYEEAMKSPETEAEARVRSALFLDRLGEYRQAIDLLERPMPESPDKYVRFLVHLARGKVLRRLGRLDEAEAAFRSALATWPGAQSARISLMTLFATGGDPHEAAALAEATETAPDGQLDPWWTYWLGDARVYPDIIARLRELTR